jgi:hypothetical protein
VDRGSPRPNEKEGSALLGAAVAFMGYGVVIPPTIITHRYSGPVLE